MTERIGSTITQPPHSLAETNNRCSVSMEKGFEIMESLQYYTVVMMRSKTSRKTLVFKPRRYISLPRSAEADIGVSAIIRDIPWTRRQDAREQAPYAGITPTYATLLYDRKSNRNG